MAPVIRNIKIPILFTCILLWTAGCLKEDNENCPRGLLVYFTPENPKHDLSELFRTADLYFYNEFGELVIRLNYGRQHLRKDGSSILTGEIPQGNYTLVSVINDVDNYHTSGEQRFESLQTSLKNDVSGERLVDLFTGISTVTVTKGNSPEEIWVDIFKHNNDIRLDVLYDGYEIPEGSALRSHIGGNNGVHDYEDGTSPQASYRRYVPYRVSNDRNRATFDFSVLRLWRNSDLTLRLEEIDPSEEVKGAITLNITDELAKVVNDQGEFLFNTDKKLSFNDDFNIVIKLRADLTIIELTINGWYVIGGQVDV